MICISPHWQSQYDLFVERNGRLDSHAHLARHNLMIIPHHHHHLLPHAKVIADVIPLII